MQDVIIRHPKERKSKCSVEPLRGRKDLIFLKAGPDLSFDATGYVLLAPGETVLSPADCEYPLLLLDSTWRLLPALESCVRGRPIRRSLPPQLQTAYPRQSKLHRDPLSGLATVEALYAARKLLGRNTDGLLDDYYWKDAFVAEMSKL